MDHILKDLVLKNEYSKIKKYLTNNTIFLKDINTFLFKYLIQVKQNNISYLLYDYFNLHCNKDIMLDMIYGALEFNNIEAFYFYFEKYKENLTKDDIIFIFKSTAFLKEENIEIFRLLMNFYEFDYKSFDNKYTILNYLIITKNYHFILELINHKTFPYKSNMDYFLKNKVSIKQKDFDFVKYILNVDDF